MALTVNTNIINDTDQYLLDAKNVKGTFAVVASTSARDSLPTATVMKGTLCYCQADGKFYRYTGNDATNTSSSWTEQKFGTNSIATSSALGLVKSSTTGTTANRDYNVQVNSDGTMKVNVPWTDNDTDTHNSHKINSGKKSNGSTDIISAAASSGDITLGDSGVTAGTYKRVTVNSKGIVVGGDNTDDDTHYTNSLQIKGNGTEAVNFTQDADKSLNLKPGDNVSISAASGEITISAENTWRPVGTGATDAAAGNHTHTYAAASKVAVTDTNKKLVTSTITTTELGHLSGITENIQDKFDEIQDKFDSLTLQKLVEDAGELKMISQVTEECSLLNETELRFSSNSDDQYANLSKSSLYFQSPDYVETNSQLTNEKLSFKDYSDEDEITESLTLSAQELVFDWDADSDKATLNRDSLIFRGEDGYTSQLGNSSLTISSIDSDKEVTYDQDRIFIETTSDGIYDKYELKFPKKSGSLLTNSCINNNTTLTFGGTVQFGSVTHMDGTMSTFKLTLPALPSTANDQCAFTAATETSASTTEYPLLFKPSTGSTTTAGKPKFTTTVTLKPGSGEIAATSFWAKSDRRLKENIEEFKPQKSILDLPIVKFNFKDASKVHIGCIAQDLQEICPEIVDTNSEGYLSINESKLVYLLLDEVKKLKEEIKELKNK